MIVGTIIRKYNLLSMNQFVHPTSYSSIFHLVILLFFCSAVGLLTYLISSFLQTYTLIAAL